MLVDFQKALADLTASPSLCRAVRQDPLLLVVNYQLTDLEVRQLTGLVQSRGMEANCMLYRANRLVPLILHLPDTLDALGAERNNIISRYWEVEPVTNVNFLVEAERFCSFLQGQQEMSPAVSAIVTRELVQVTAQREAWQSQAQISAL